MVFATSNGLGGDAFTRKYIIEFRKYKVANKGPFWRMEGPTTVRN